MDRGEDMYQHANTGKTGYTVMGQITRLKRKKQCVTSENINKLTRESLGIIIIWGTTMFKG